ncbi:MAG: hypothetical protein LBM74_06120 [Oscillospiraceae bacterium]|jgi:hypothetical protein|nr:hypothetical protein [Oscillospiraceae bacterium]
MKKRKGGFARGLALMLAVFAVLFFGAYVLLGGISSETGNKETELVRNAVRDAVLTCYAVEGFYPQQLEYLKEHYGLGFNEDRYFVYYDAFASNIMPEIRVTEKGAVIPW